MRKAVLGLAAIAAIAIPLTIAPAANAADGDQLIVGGDFESSTAVNPLSVPGASTVFNLSTGLFGNWGNRDQGSMYDPGRYVIGDNPADHHELWVDWGNDAIDKMMFVNGFETLDQKVLSTTVTPAQCRSGATLTYQFSANMASIVKPGVVTNGGAKIRVTINGALLGTEDVLSESPAPYEIVGDVPWAPSLEVTIWNDGTAYSGNDFAIDDIKLTQMGECEPPCEPTTIGVWHNYTGKFAGTGTPALNDPKWKALPATPGGEHALALRGFDKPYNPGADKGKGDWFVWKDLGTTCPSA